MSRPSSASSTNFSAFLSDLPAMSCKRQAAERQRQAVAHARAVHVDQFERTAAEIADDAVRLVNAGDDAERGEMRLALARQHLDRRAADALGFAR